MQDYHCFCEFLMDFHSENWCCVIAHDVYELKLKHFKTLVMLGRKLTICQKSQCVCGGEGVWWGRLPRLYKDGNLPQTRRLLIILEPCTVRQSGCHSPLACGCPGRPVGCREGPHLGGGGWEGG